MSMEIKQGAASCASIPCDECTKNTGTLHIDVMVTDGFGDTIGYGFCSEECAGRAMSWMREREAEGVPA